MKPLLSLFFLLAFFPAQAATLTTNEVFVRLQTTIESGKGFKQLVEDLGNLDNKELVAILKEFDQTWPQLRNRYLKDHQEFIRSQFTGEAKNEATREIRKFNKDVVILAQTAFALSGDKEKAIGVGCNDYISKPIDQSELDELIKKYLIRQ